MMKKKLLLEFADMLQKWSGDSEKFLCAHNGKEFDYPYICRRMVINGIGIPEVLKIAGRKHLGGAAPGYDGAVEIRGL